MSKKFFDKNDDTVLHSTLTEGYEELIDIRNKIIPKEELSKNYAERLGFNLNKNLKSDFLSLYKTNLKTQNLEKDNTEGLKALAKFKYDSIKLLCENYKEKFDDNELKTMNFFLTKYKDVDYEISLKKSSELYNKLSQNGLNLEEKDLLSLISATSLRNKDLVLYGFKINLELKNNMTTNPELNQQVAKSSTPSMNNF